MLQNTLKALSLLHDFQKVERVVFVPQRDRQENDVEHSYLLAMLAWQLAEILAPQLSKEKVIKYALVHDLVEVYAGDVFFTIRVQMPRSIKRVVSTMRFVASLMRRSSAKIFVSRLLHMRRVRTTKRNLCMHLIKSSPS